MASLRRPLSLLLVLPCFAACDGSISPDGVASDDGDSLSEPAGLCHVERCEGDACNEAQSLPKDDYFLVKKDFGQLPAPTTPRPDVPLITRSVRLAEKVGTQKFLAPYIPAWRSTADGRIAMVQQLDGVASIRPTLIEKLRDNPVSAQETDLAAHIFGDGVPINKSGMMTDKMLPAGTDLDGSFICQRHDNPSACGEHDCYDLVLILRELDSHGKDDPGVMLRSVPMTVEVAKPKTEGAHVISVAFDFDHQKESKRLPFTSTGEMVPSRDGHLVSARLHMGADTGGGVPLRYALNSRDDVVTRTVSLAYAYAEDPCNVEQWMAYDGDKHVFGSLRPISAAPYDPRLFQGSTPTYGLAARPMRNAQNEVLAEDEVLAGSYPWMDREGNNYFFSTVEPDPVTPDEKGARWALAPVKGKPRYLPTAPRGFAMVGAWTQGKTVMLDGRLNNDDSGFDAYDSYDLSLYQSGGQPVAVRVNGGSNNGVKELKLPNADGNDDEIESLENNTSMHGGSLPITPREVVWTVTRGLSSDEIAFDDFLNPNLVLFAEMNATWEQRHGQAAKSSYKDGFSLVKRAEDDKDAQDHYRFDDGDIRLQNSATSPLYPLAEPGTVTAARVEPVALGGVRGRGLWLAGDGQATFAFPPEMTRAARNSDFTVGLFVDARDALEGRHHLFTLTSKEKDVSPLSVELDAGVSLRFVQGKETKVVDISCEAKTWDHTFHHLAVLFHADGRASVFLDGNPARTAHLSQAVALTSGSLVVGGPSPVTSHPGVNGWYDEVRVELNGNGNPLTSEASIETLCNAAHGTMAAVADGSKFYGAAKANPFAQARAAELNAPPIGKGELYYCLTDLSKDLGIGRGRLGGAGNAPLRADILLEGTKPLVYDEPRPKSTQRSFCLSCHVDASVDEGRPVGLTFEALVLHKEVTAELDPRVQPMQPPTYGGNWAQALGVIPERWISIDGQMLPAKGETGPKPILRWVLR